MVLLILTIVAPAIFQAYVAHDKDGDEWHKVTVLIELLGCHNFHAFGPNPLSYNTMPDNPKDLPAAESAAKSQPAPDIPVPTSQPIQAASASVASHDRAELLVRARAFLTSPQVRLQDSDAKRTFLEEKGLTPSEVDQLLRELVSH